MTDEDRRIIEREVKEFTEQKDLSWMAPEDLYKRGFTHGYKTAREAKQNPNVGGFTDDIMGLEGLLEAERARSAKLVEILRSISTRINTSRIELGWTDLVEIGPWADKAIAEYEASRD